MNIFTHPHLAMQKPHLYDTPTLLALYAECAPWCETATLKAMHDALTRRGVALPTLQDAIARRGATLPTFNP